MVPCLGQKVSLLLAVIVHTFTSTYSEFSCLKHFAEAREDNKKNKTSHLWWPLLYILCLQLVV